MEDIALIDYGSGNIHSAARALHKAADMAGKACTITLTHDPHKVYKADRIVLPGVGHFADCAAALKSRDGLVEALDMAVHTHAKPFLGICVGMQLLADTGWEDGSTPGLGWIAGEVGPITPKGGLPIPHMGWNTITPTRPHPLMAGLGPDPHVYFVHSYAFQAANPACILAETDYGGLITALIGKDNICGTQFHPEKSQRAGLRFLANFIDWTL